MEVVNKEIFKWLDVTGIYPISNSKWVSLVQVVPKKSEITIIKNYENSLVPIRIQTGWRVSMDNRKVKTNTKKYHFPLLFIDQAVKRLACHTFYCFLDSYLGYNQISITTEDQEKTTFNCHFETFAFLRMSFSFRNALIHR